MLEMPRYYRLKKLYRSDWEIPFWLWSELYWQGYRHWLEPWPDQADLFWAINDEEMRVASTSFE